MTSPPDAPSGAGASGEAASALPAWWKLALVGVVGGVLSGMFGVGGGILMVPLLVTFLHFDQRRAAATSLAAIVPAAIAGTIAYGIPGQIDLLTAVLVAIGGIGGSWVGSHLLRRLPLGWLRWGFIVILVAAGVRMLFELPERTGEPVEMTVLIGISLVLVGFVVGVASGLFGVGGGVLMVPALILLYGVDDLVAKGTSLAFMIPTALSGTIANRRAHLVSLRSGLTIGAAATIASFGGVAIAFWLPPQIAGWLFAALVFVAAVQLAIKALRARSSSAR